MPLVLHPRVRRGVIGLATMGAVASLGTGVARADCPVQTGTQVFAAFGDTADYVLAPGGSFEDATSSWTSSTGPVTPSAGNESFFANSPTDTQSVQLKSGASVVSPPFCVDATFPSLRLFAKKVVGVKGSIKVEVLYKDQTGAAKQLNSGSVIQGGRNANGDYADWAPSPSLKLGSGLPLAKSATGDMPVQLKLTSDQEPGTWAVDDVFVDPYRGR